MIIGHQDHKTAHNSLLKEFYLSSDSRRLWHQNSSATCSKHQTEKLLRSVTQTQVGTRGAKRMDSEKPVGGPPGQPIVKSN